MPLQIRRPARGLVRCGRLAAVVLALVAGPSASAQAPGPQPPDVIYLPTPPFVVRAMLEAAGVTAADVVYDLGSGDGRIPVAAARDFGARAVGVDIDPALVREARANAETAGVADRVRFLNQDLFDTDISEATVVTLYLLPSLNEQLRPKLNAELAPGARVVSHEFGLGRWAPDVTLNVGGGRVLVWTIPID
jgi:SAM-dependent methyltransferase